MKHESDGSACLVYHLHSESQCQCIWCINCGLWVPAKSKDEECPGKQKCQPKRESPPVLVGSKP
jgi:hypothetical protein